MSQTLDDTDSVELRFTGKLSDQNRMDFYESARVQYAAARLSVKLDKFRRTGSFPDKVTRKSNTGLDLTTFKDGSFRIQFIAPPIESGARGFLNVPVSALWAYVIERVFSPAQSDDIRRSLATKRALLSEYERLVVGQEDQASLTRGLLERELATGRALESDSSELLNRLVAEAARRDYLARLSPLLARITAQQDADLVTMAAPLLKDFNVPLRRSAAYASISIGKGASRKPVLNLDEIMATDVELSRIDPTPTVLRIDIVQYDKENGWGKFRNEEFEGRASFSVAADKKERLQGMILRHMNKPEVLVEAQYVRSLGGVKKRIILLGFPKDVYEN